MTTSDRRRSYVTQALGLDTVLFTITIPGWLVALLLIAVWLLAYVLAARWFDRRFLDPWLRRRAGLPPKEAQGCTEACSETHTYSWPCEALGEFGRAFAEDLARNTSSERLRRIALEQLAADRAATNAEVPDER